MHSQLKMLYLIQPNFIIVLTALFFLAHNDRFFLSWDDRTVICPALHLKEEENDCSLLGRKKHTGGMWPQGRDFGYREGTEVRGVWQTNTCYGAQKEKKKKGTLNPLLSRLKQKFIGNKSFLFSQDTRSSLRGVDGIQLPRRSVHPTQPLHPAALGTTLGGARPYSKPSLWWGRRIKQRLALLEAGIWIRNRDAGAMQTVLRELLIKRTSSEIKTVCRISVKNKTITNAIIFFHVSLVK